MREILFKGKRIDNGEWVEGYYSPHPNPFSGFLKDYIFAPYYDKEKECGYDNGYQIDANTLCQYTGLTDKNGRKIWENDIVYIPYISLDDSYCRVVFKYGTFIGEMADGCDDCITNRKAEVIGNIFDNPELLEKAR